MPRVESSIRKKMRKGTHSCFECRRRKIRCIFPADHPSVCAECFARGSKCIDQENAESDVVVDHRKNLRERVSRLEALVESLVQDRSERGAVEALGALRRDPLLPPTPHSSDSASSVITPDDSTRPFGNPSVQRASSSASDSPNEPQQACNFTAALGNLELTCRDLVVEDSFCTENDATKSANRSKYLRTRKELLALLPGKDGLRGVSLGNTSWWEIWREKMPGGTENQESLSDFCRRAFKDDSPIAELATAVIGIGLSIESDSIDGILATVDRLVTSDDEYAATIEGLECLILTAKCYADVGQPRKTWLNFRRGLSLAQLMGIHRSRSGSKTQESIWWTLWAGDRFLSLLLGLPYGINDAHCNLQSSQYDPQSLEFLVTMAKVAGKVIDRTQGHFCQSYASAHELDQEMDAIAAKMPSSWWDINPEGVGSGWSAFQKREAVMSQIIFHQIRVFLHLPFMFQFSTNPRFEYSKNICLSSARSMVLLYHAVRAGNGEPLSECKAVDFLGFTAAIVLVLGLLGYDRQSRSQTPQQEESDWRLIEISMDIFRRASSEKGGKVAAQSFAVLEQLHKLRDQDLTKVDNAVLNTKIAIPYFGTISIRQRPSASQAPLATTADQASKHVQNTNGFVPDAPIYIPTTADTNTDSNVSNSLNPDPLIAYDGFYMGNMDYEQHNLSEDPVLNFGVPNNNGIWQNAATMDIDQDWGWLLTDPQPQQFTQPF